MTGHLLQHVGLAKEGHHEQLLLLHVQPRTAVHVSIQVHPVSTDPHGRLGRGSEHNWHSCNCTGTRHYHHHAQVVRLTTQELRHEEASNNDYCQPHSDAVNQVPQTKHLGDSEEN